MAYSLPKNYKPNTKSGYKGVYKRKILGATLKKPWTAYIKIGKKSKTIGNFATKKEAAIAYNEYAKTIKGKKLYLNTIDHS